VGKNCQGELSKGTFRRILENSGAKL